MLTDTSVRLDLAEILVLSDVLALQTLPPVLRVEEVTDDVGEAVRAGDAARLQLVERGLLDEFMNPDPMVSRVLSVLADPDWRVEVRRADVTQVLRVCVAAAGPVRCVAVRSGDRFDLRESTAEDDETLVSGEIAPLIGVSVGAPIPTLRFPSALLDSHLARCVTELEHAEAFYALGLTPDVAKAVAATLADCCGQTEIVVRVGALIRAVLAVFDTTRGRVISIAVTSDGGERWTTIHPGDEHAVRSALRRLSEELPRGEL